MERRLGGLVLGHLVLPRCERAAQVGVARLLELHRTPSFRAALGARAAGQGREREREHQGATHGVAYLTVNRTVSTTSGFRGTCFQSATTAITRWGPGVRESTTNSACPRPRCRIPVTPRGIVSSAGVRSWSTKRWWCPVPGRSSVAGTISTPVALSVTFTGPLTVAPLVGAVIFTFAPVLAWPG